MGKLLLAKLINQETNKKKVENLDRQKQGTGEPTCFASHNQVTLNSEEVRWEYTSSISIISLFPSSNWLEQYLFLLAKKISGIHLLIFLWCCTTKSIESWDPSSTKLNPTSLLYGMLPGIQFPSKVLKKFWTNLGLGFQAINYCKCIYPWLSPFIDQSAA